MTGRSQYYSGRKSVDQAVRSTFSIVPNLDSILGKGEMLPGRIAIRIDAVQSKTTRQVAQGSTISSSVP